jgi:2-polyprenyl-3-methyl-5-hydroxy-6-metoxy-1,4-benzoquinol methylase
LGRTDSVRGCRRAACRLERCNNYGEAIVARDVRQDTSRVREAVEYAAGELMRAADWDGVLVTMQPGHPTYNRRVEFDIQLVLKHCGRPAGDLTVVDLGGGLGMFSLALAALGARSILADAFYHFPNVDRVMPVWERNGVTVINCDLLDEPLGLDADSVDAVTNFHFLEHLHRSPKRLFHGAVKGLKPGGIFVVGGPNCVNLRKRITVPLGYGKWSSMEEWYEAQEFWGHVREPDVSDLVYICRDLGFQNIATYGCNFLGRGHTGLRGRAAEILDPVLRRVPSLCSDIYAVGW